jgi:hypothetical protein
MLVNVGPSLLNDSFLSLPFFIDSLHHLFVFFRDNCMSWFHLNYLSSKFPVDHITCLTMFYMKNKVDCKSDAILANKDWHTNISNHFII